MGMLCTSITDIKLFPPSKLGTQEQAGWLIIKTACDALHDLVLFVKFKKRKKHPWRNATFTKSNTPPWVFYNL